MLVREGVAGLTVRAVAAEAGVAPMGVYNRFGSKDGLVDAVLVRGFELLRAAVARDRDADPVRRLIASGRNYRRFALDRPEHYSTMFGRQSGRHEASPELADRAGAAFQALVDHVSYAMSHGALRPGDEQEVAQVIFGAVHGAVSLELAGVRLTPDPEATYEALLAALVAGLA